VTMAFEDLTDDEFQFRPLTEGLGFHKKSVAAKRQETFSDREHGEFRAPAKNSNVSDAKAHTISFEPNDLKEEPADKSRDAIRDLMNRMPRLDFLETPGDTVKSRTGSDSAADSRFNSLTNANRVDGTSIPIAKFERFRGESNSRVGTTQLRAPETKLKSTALPTQTTGGPSSQPVRKSERTPPPALAKPQIQNPALKTSNPLNSSAISGRLDKIPNKTQVDSQVAAHPKENQSAGKTTAPNLLSLFTDLLVVVGLTTLFAVVLVVVAEIDFGLLISNVRTDLPTQIGSLVLLLSVTELYLIISRGIFGASLGEWATEVELGTPAQQSSAIYPIWVAWRGLVSMLLFWILIPLSIAMKTDLLSKLTGLSLRRSI